MVDIEKLTRTLRTRLRDGATLKKIAKNAQTLEDAQRFAEEAGNELFSTLNRLCDVSTMSQDELSDALVAMSRETFAEVKRVCEKAQIAINSQADLEGLGLLDIDFDSERVRGIAEAVAGGADASPEYLKNLIVNNTLKTVDESAEKNSAAYENMGLKVRIIRKYDGVGLKGGTKPCQWCIDRAGTYNSVEEATAAGVFQRHPGCGCLITYEVGKKRTWQNRAGAWHEE